MVEFRYHYFDLLRSFFWCAIFYPYNLHDPYKDCYKLWWGLQFRSTLPGFGTRPNCSKKRLFFVPMKCSLYLGIRVIFWHSKHHQSKAMYTYWLLSNGRWKIERIFNRRSTEAKCSKCNVAVFQAGPGPLVPHISDIVVRVRVSCHHHALLCTETLRNSKKKKLNRTNIYQI